ncbi:MAG: biopolymer transporter ExbD [Bacteroidetes bacterium]|nr:biopolymer transporter ExbD [Bacteroidota bacterium]
MAALDSTAGDRRHQKSLSRGKKLSTKVDLTPMVDLGFLLTTFFMVSTAWTKPKVTSLNMPADGDSTTLSEKVVLTLLAGSDNNIYYYPGHLDQSLKEGSGGITGYSIQNGIGEIIRQKQSWMDQYYKGGRKEMMVLIKASSDASYENLVSLLDEMLINQVGKYAIVDISEEEKNLLKEKKL